MCRHADSEDSESQRGRTWNYHLSNERKAVKMYGWQSSWYKLYQCLQNLSVMDLLLSSPSLHFPIPLLHQSPNTFLNYLGSSRKPKWQLNLVTTLHIYSHSYNSFLLTKKQYKGVARRNWKIKVCCWGISKGSKGKRPDTHTRLQYNKVFTNIRMESTALNYNPIIRTQKLNYMVGSCLPKGILEMWSLRNLTS